MSEALAKARPAISFPLLLGLAGLSFVICYASAMASLVNLWSTYPLYSHGYAVPVIAGWLCWTRYQDSAPISRKPDYVLGIPLILLGIGFMIVGQIGSVQTVRQTSLIVALAGFILVFFGRKTFAFYRFPFAYLLFMVPVWDVVLNHLQDPSRIVSARIATGLLHLVNVPVLRQEALLVLPTVTLSVMRQCSGVNQLVAMLAMVVPASYVFLNANGRRVMLVAFSVLVVYLSNGFRIALVGWLATKGLSDGNLAASYTHVLEGLVVSAVGYAVIMGALSWLARFNTTPETLDKAPSAPPVATSSCATRRPLLDFAVIATLLFAGVAPLVATSTIVSPPRDLRLLPGTLGGWREADNAASAGHSAGISEDLVGAYRTPAGVRRFDGVDAELSRVYENASAVRLRLYVGYYGRQEEGRELMGDAGHVLAAASSPVAFTVGSQTVKAREVVQSGSAGQRGILYWYDINGQIVSDTLLAKAYTIWNGLTQQRTNGAVVMITWESAPAVNDDGRGQAQAFARELLPVLRPYLDGTVDKRATTSLRNPTTPLASAGVDRPAATKHSRSTM